MKKTISILIFTACLLGFKASAQIQQFGQPTFLSGPTNSSILVTTIAGYYLPPISLTITCTNTTMICTNIIQNTLWTSPTNMVPAITFIYNASIYGTNFTTNFPAIFVPFTNFTYGTAIPGVNSSNIWIK